MTSSARDDPLDFLYHGPQTKVRANQVRGASAGLAAKINSDHSGTLAHRIRCRCSRFPGSSSVTIKSAEAEKKQKYLDHCLEQIRHFTPFVVSCKGMMGRKDDSFIHHLSKRLSKDGLDHAARKSDSFLLVSPSP